MNEPPDAPETRRRHVPVTRTGDGAEGEGDLSEQAAPDASPPSGAGSSSPALSQLMSGNRRFVDGRPLHPNQSEARRAEVAAGQHPVAVILACADSRVAPELVFDQGLGDLFIIRVAGNVADPVVTGSIEYAVEHLQVPLIVVMGHSGCGAVTAAVGSGIHVGQIGSLIRLIEPAVEACRGQGGDAIDNVITANAKHQAQRLARESWVISEAIHAARTRLVAARYDMQTGEVSLLD